MSETGPAKAAVDGEPSQTFLRPCKGVLTPEVAKEELMGAGLKFEVVEVVKGITQPDGTTLYTVNAWGRAE